MMEVIRIGTRKSELALKQAHTVGELLLDLGLKYEIIELDSKGDLDLETPLYELGVVGVFTKVLDVELLKGKIDIAVHSLKDVPTALPKGIVQAAVLERDNPTDILAMKKGKTPDFESSLTIATGSIRRKAQWLHKYPNHTICGLRGNVNTRLRKLEENDWDGAIFSAAGLERIQLTPDNYQVLNWMVPAPAQGVIAVTVLESNKELYQIVNQINHSETEITSVVERAFLRELEGGCSAPIGAYASIENDQVFFHGILDSIDGQVQVEIKKEMPCDRIEGFGELCARELLENGGREIMDQLNNVNH